MIVDLAAERLARSPHAAGMAECLGCRHEWAAVIPAEAKHSAFECPSCGLHKGVFKFLFSPDTAVWVCHCENDLFVLTPRGAFCPSCGDWQTWQTS